MTGNEYYDNRYKTRIENCYSKLNNKKQLKTLKGFEKYMAIDGTLISTRMNYVGRIVTFLNKVDKELKDIEFADYVDYLSLYQDKTSSYQIQIYTALKRFSEYLSYSKITKADYMENVKRPKDRESIETKQKREKSFLTEKELEKFLLRVTCGMNVKESPTQKTVQARDHALIMILLGTGLRCSAVSKLDISDVDLESGKIQVTEKRGKVRTCYLSEDIITILKTWLDERNNFVTEESDNALFLSSEGNRLNDKRINKIIEKYGEGIKKGVHLSPHKLRATYGTMIYKKTGDIYLTKNCMGHSDISTTMLYVRGQEEQAQKKAAEVMAGVLF